MYTVSSKCVCESDVIFSPLCRLFSFGEFKAEDQEEMLKQLDKKVAEVYTKLIGTSESTVR